MNSIKANLNEWKELRRRKQELESSEKDALSPLLRDMHTIRKVYELMQELVRNETYQKILHTPYLLKFEGYFLIIVCLLYSPGTWMGKPLRKGCREKIAEVMQITPCAVSNRLRQVLHNFEHNKTIQNVASQLYEEVITKIKEYQLK